MNPYWIEDRDLLNGKRDFLSGHEDKFWKDLIEKYLAPLEKDEKKEKKNAADLITLRNKSVFSVFMLNALFVLVVFMLQTEKDMIGIEWPLEQSIKYAIFYEDNEMVSKGPFKYYVIKEVGGWGQIMAIFDALGGIQVLRHHVFDFFRPTHPAL